MVKDDHLLYVVSSKVMTKNHRYECKIKGGDFNMDGLEESRKKKRDISGPEVGSERGLGGVMYDETMRMYVPKVNTFENNWLHQCWWQLVTSMFKKQFVTPMLVTLCDVVKFEMLLTD